MESEASSSAIIRTGGRQYRVATGNILRVATLTGSAGESVAFDEVLAIVGPQPRLGQPLVAGAKVEATIVKHGRDKKIVVFKFKRRKRYQRKMGHRQGFTEVKINAIVAGAA